VFQPTILLRQNERKPIDELFPNFLKWSTSNGATNQDWYVK
jgi:LruC domain-containing protein